MCVIIGKVYTGRARVLCAQCRRADGMAGSGGLNWLTAHDLPLPLGFYSSPWLEWRTVQAKQRSNRVAHAPVAATDYCHRAAAFALHNNRDSGYTIYLHYTTPRNIIIAF